MCMRKDALLGAYKSFQPGETSPKYCRSRNFAIRHSKLSLLLDDKKKKISGEVTHNVLPLIEGVQSITLDAVDLHIKRIMAEGKSVDFRHTDHQLIIEFGRRLKTGHELPVTIYYEGQPEKGLYFTGPDAGYPKKPVQIWTQGEMEDSRHWIPCYDYPNNKATFELHITARSRFTVVGGGTLIETKEDKKAQLKTWHYRMDTPVPAYLIMLAAGDFEVQRSEAEGVPIENYVAKGLREKMNRSFSKTGAMLALFNELTGVNYPYSKYAQICVQDFIFGGMENVSATILTDTTLHDARAHLDVSSDPLLAHELAHQWFGDLVTCRDWSHIWLNEGFATYFETLFAEKDLGRDEFHLKIKQLHDSYFDEDSSRYRRPIVTNEYADPEEMFDRHTYEKGGSVLHMLRRVLGDESFFRTIAHYVEKHRGRNVVTQDLIGAIEETSGQNLDWFFDQWVFGAGYPQFTVSHDWDDGAKLLRLRVKQTQKLEAKTSIFRIPFELEVTTAKGAKSFHLTCDRAEQDFFVPVDARPIMVLFDKGGQILKTLEHSKTRAELLYQLQSADGVLDRIWAARELGRSQSGPAVVRALEHSLLHDPFYGVRQAAATALGEIKAPECVAALQKGLFERNSKVRRAVMAALGVFKENDAVHRLAVKKLGSDDSYFVRAEAVTAIAKSRHKEAYSQVTKALRQDSHRDIVRARAAEGLAHIDDPRGISVLKEWIKYGKPLYARIAAVNALARLARGKAVEGRGVRELLGNLTEDAAYYVRGAAIDALGELGDKAAAADLDRISRRERDGRLRRRAKDALLRLASGPAEGQLRMLETRIDSLTDENKGLKMRVERLAESVDRNRKGEK